MRAEILEVPGKQVVGRLAAEPPGDGRRHRAIVQRIEVPPGRQYIEPSAGRRPRWTGRDEPAVEPLKHSVDFPPAAVAQGKADGKSRFSPAPAPSPCKAALLLDKLHGQQFEPLYRIAIGTPGVARESREMIRPRSRPGPRPSRKRADRAAETDLHICKVC